MEQDTTSDKIVPIDETPNNPFMRGDTVKVIYEDKAYKCFILYGEHQAYRKVNGAGCDFAYYVFDTRIANEKNNHNYLTIRFEDVFLTRVVLTEKTIERIDPF